MKLWKRIKEFLACFKIGVRKEPPFKRPDEKFIGLELKLNRKNRKVEDW